MQPQVDMVMLYFCAEWTRELDTHFMSAKQIFLHIIPKSLWKYGPCAVNVVYFCASFDFFGIFDVKEREEERERK